MRLNDFANLLKTNDIWVHSDENRLFCGIPIENVNSRSFLPRYGRHVCIHEDQSLDITLLDPIYVEAKDAEWEFKNCVMETHGVENLNGFFGRTRDLFEFSRFILHYFNKPPVEICGWSVPVYQLPSWSLEKAEKTISNARNISQSEIRDLIVSGRRKAQEKPSALDANAHFYYPVYETGDNAGMFLPVPQSNVLYVRYDLNRAYVAEFKDATATRLIG